MPAILAIDPSTTNVSRTFELVFNEANTCKDLDRCRTLLDILWSCISVLIACTWVSIHQNLPGPDEGFWDVLWRKVGLMLMALIAPEFVVLWAVRQWYAAEVLQKEYEANRWTRTHASFALMGGFMLYEGQKPICVLRESQPNEPQGTFHAQATFIGQMTENQINDRSHSDSLSKLVAVGQTAWFVAQLIARRIQNLPITALETMTAAFAAMHFFIYFWWWNKPLGVSCHVGVQKRVDVGCGADRAQSASNIVIPIRRRLSSDRQPPLDLRKGQYHIALLSKFVPNCGSTLSQVRRFIYWLGRLGTGLLDFFSIHSIVVWDEHHNIIGKSFPNSGILGKAVIIATYLVMAPFHEAFFSLTNTVRPPNSATKVSSFERTGGDLEPPHFFDRIVAYTAAMAFGGIHCAAWSFLFPSELEKFFWRTASLVVTCVPVFVAFAEVLLREYDYKYRMKRAIFSLLILGPTFLYIPARLALLVQGFLALRNLPPGAFEAVQWTPLIPHI